jgi:hypothetical protein
MFSQIFKRMVAKATMAAIMFAQLAIAAYACPTVDGPASVIAAARADAAMHAEMPGCGMRKSDSNPNLCLQHCQAGDQSVQTLPPVAVPAFVALSTWTLIEPVVAQADPGIALISAWPHHATSPPPLVRFGVLRI